jgi:uncharacterized protein (TIGR03086 family)
MEVLDPVDALERATASFAGILVQVRDDQWNMATPDPGWSVRDLVNHVVGGNRRYVLLLTGAPTVEVEALRDLDHLGADPCQDFAETSAAVTAAFRVPGATQRTVHHRLGDRSGAELLVMRVIEHTLHGWDLARAIGVDDRLDPAVAQMLLTAFDRDPTMLARSSFTPHEPPADAGPEQRLLMLTGRNVHFPP